MKSRLAAALAAATLIFTTAGMFFHTAGAAASEAGPAKAQLLNLERMWSKAARQRDTAALRRILSDDYIDINYKGALKTKADALRAPNVPPHRHQPTFARWKIRVYGNTAVVTGLGTLVVKHHRYRWRFTDVFVSHGSAWRAVSSQETVVQP